MLFPDAPDCFVPETRTLCVHPAGRLVGGESAHRDAALVPLDPNDSWSDDKRPIAANLCGYDLARQMPPMGTAGYVWRLWEL